MTEVITVMGVAKALKRPLDDLYELGKTKFSHQLRRFRYAKHVNTLYKRISRVQKVKTIWQTEREVNLKSFYYPSRVVVNKEEISVSSIKQLPNFQNIVLEGTVGQGKSIFLRYLCYRELMGGETVPVFFELRKIVKGKTLTSYLIRALEELGFDITEEFFDFLLGSGKLTLLLDAFDEIDPVLAPAIVDEIEHLCSKFETLKIIVTSRPNSGIQRLPTFRVYSLAKLSQHDYAGILSKLLQDKSQEEEVLKALTTSSLSISELLVTPLMMTLLVVAYKSEVKIPEQFSEFYENLFQTLLVRHDKSKPGYVRKRSCSNLNERQLQEVFEAFCFLCVREARVTMTSDEAYDVAKKAAALTSHECDALAFIDDVERVSCLLLKEAFEYHFIHKSVEEYYAARFMSRRPDEIAKKFYGGLLGNISHKWLQVVAFLEEIDRYRVTKYLLIPDAEKCMELLGYDGNGEITDKQYEQVMSLVYFDVKVGHSEFFSDSGRGEQLFNGYLYDPVFELYKKVSREVRKIDIKLLFDVILAEAKSSAGRGIGNLEINGYRCCEVLDLTEVGKNVATRICRNIFDECQEHQNYVTRERDVLNSILDDL